jgi:type IV fimbrial biogenesis protein FimT
MLDQMTCRKATPQSRAEAGFTLVEAIVVIAILGVILTLVAPSALDWIIMQRVKANASELVTDIRFARGESIKRGQPVIVAFKSVNGDQTCYVVHTRAGGGKKCDCLKGAGKACATFDPDFPDEPGLSDTLVELKLVSVAAGTRVAMTANRDEQKFLALNGYPDPAVAGSFQVDFDGQNSRQLRVVTNAAGRPVICAPAGSRIAGYPACT